MESAERPSPPQALRVVPILRIFSVEKAREFHLDYTGFHLDWEQRSKANAPLHMQVWRDGLVLHLTEHYGDGSPGACFHVEYRGVAALHHELSGKKYPYWRPGITKTFRGAPQLNLLDPFGNKLCLGEPESSPAPTSRPDRPCGPPTRSRP
jgi:glyoxalase superfamily protein